MIQIKVYNAEKRAAYYLVYNIGYIPTGLGSCPKISHNAVNILDI